MTDLFIEDLLKVKLIPINQIKPSEEHNIDKVDSLLMKITHEGVWTNPILIESNNSVIMDGHHRYQVAKKLNLSSIPCLILGYDNPYLEVKTYMHENHINVQDIINAGLSGKLLKYKSTRHKLSYDLLGIKIPIKILSSRC